MTKRPDTYPEWRSLWHQLANWVGHEVAWNIARGRPVVSRSVWKQVDQMRRVRLRMEVEQKAFTESYGRELLKSLGLGWPDT